MARAALMLAIALLAGCSTSTMKRDVEIQGSLPRLIGLGAFTPLCLFLCFIDSRTTQGDSVAAKIEEGEPLVVRSVTQHELKGGGAVPMRLPTVKAKPRIALKPATTTTTTTTTKGNTP
jgi:hypothetical protein